MAERHAQVLAELAEIGLAAARELNRRLAEAEAAAEAAQIAMALQRVSRSVRQSLALEAKLGRQADQAAREAAQREDWARTVEALDAGRAKAQPAGPVDRRRDRVEALVDRCIWDEAEKLSEGEDWFERRTTRLAELLNDDIFDPRFLDLTVEAHVTRLCADLGLEPPRPRAPWPVPSGQPGRLGETSRAPAAADAELAALSYAPPCPLRWSPRRRRKLNRRPADAARIPACAG